MKNLFLTLTLLVSFFEARLYSQIQQPTDTLKNIVEIAYQNALNEIKQKENCDPECKKAIKDLKSAERKTKRDESKAEREIRLHPDESDDELTPSISIVGNGDLQDLTSQNDFSANTGVGIVLNRIWTSGAFREVYFDFYTNIASTVDTLTAAVDTLGIVLNRRDFGSYILLPLSAKQAFNLNFTTYLSPALYKNPNFFLASNPNGFNVRINASNSAWQYNSQKVNVSAFYGRLGYFIDILPEPLRLNDKYACTMGLNYTIRVIGGDISLDRYDSLRMDILGNEVIQYGGFEANISLKLNNVIIEAQLPFLFAETSQEVEGLTNLRLLTSIRFIGGVPVKTSDENKPEAELKRRSVKVKPSEK